MKQVTGTLNFVSIGNEINIENQSEILKLPTNIIPAFTGTCGCSYKSNNEAFTVTPRCAANDLYIRSSHSAGINITSPITYYISLIVK